MHFWFFPSDQQEPLTVWKSEKFSHWKKNSSNQLLYFVIPSIVKPLLSRNFCEKRVKENFCNFHNVMCNLGAGILFTFFSSNYFRFISTTFILRYFLSNEFYRWIYVLFQYSKNVSFQLSCIFTSFFSLKDSSFMAKAAKVDLTEFLFNVRVML